MMLGIYIKGKDAIVQQISGLRFTVPRKIKQLFAQVRI
jgi:hypothetical protein